MSHPEGSNAVVAERAPSGRRPTGTRKDFAKRKRGRASPRWTVSALHDRPRRVRAVLGQNGSGKSTLVRVLSTLLLADGGSAAVFGYDVERDARAVRTLVNRVSVEASFFKKLSAAENLGYASRYYGMTARQTRDLIPVISSVSASRPGAATSRWRTCPAGCSRRSLWRARC